jgi:hypothetical protein
MDKQAILNNVALILDAIESEAKNGTHMDVMVCIYPDRTVYNAWRKTDRIFRGETAVGCEEIIAHNIIAHREISDKIHELEKQIVLLKTTQTV